MKRKLDKYDLLILVFCITAGWFTISCNIRTIEPKTEFPIYKDSVFINSDTTFSEEKLNGLMYILDMEHPNIVMNQAKLETGHFTSPRFKKYNALFGFQTSDSSPIKYRSWKESVIAYKAWQMKRLKDKEDYYGFLIRIKYAKDSLYIKKLKLMELCQK